MANLSDAAKETVQDVRDAIKESGKAAVAASGDIQADLQALRDDVARLAQQIADIFAAKGGNAWRHARSGVDEAIADVEDRGRDAIDAVRDKRIPANEVETEQVRQMLVHHQADREHNRQ